MTATIPYKEQILRIGWVRSHFTWQHLEDVLVRLRLCAHTDDCTRDADGDCMTCREIHRAEEELAVVREQER